MILKLKLKYSTLSILPRPSVNTIKKLNLANDPSTPQPSESLISNFLDSVSLLKVSKEELEVLISPIRDDEILAVIKSLPNSKLPGTDGFTEYYKSCQDMLTPHTNMLSNLLASTVSFPSEMLRSTIVTLPKPGKAPDCPQNFCSISLLNSDLKIYAKILANRLASITPKLIKTDQVGFFQCRQTPDGTRCMLNLIRIAELRKTPTLFALYAEKAFDRVH